MNKFEKVPTELIERSQWVLWKFDDHRGGKPTKVPFQCNGKYADTTDPLTWTTFEAVLQTFRKFHGKYNGIGYVFNHADPYTGIDLDHCHCIEDGKLTSRAEVDIMRFNSYTEYSQSGTGIHIIAKAKLPAEKGKHVKGYEVYDNARFFVVTGDHVEGMPVTIENRQSEVAALYKYLIGETETKTTKTLQSSDMVLSDLEIIEKASRAKNGEKFTSLYEGKWSGCGYESQSEADQALCNLLAFYTTSYEQIDRIVSASGLNRDKWEREDYKERTINLALQNISERYADKKNSQSMVASANSNISQDNEPGYWEEPDPEGLEFHTLPSFDENVFPGVLRNFICGVSESTQTPVDASCMATIAILSTALSKKVAIQAYEKYTEPVNTFGVVVLPPGNRKSAVFDLFREPIYSVQTAVIAAKNGSFPHWKALMEMVELQVNHKQEQETVTIRFAEPYKK